MVKNKLNKGIKGMLADIEWHTITVRHLKNQSRALLRKQQELPGYANTIMTIPFVLA